MNRGLAITVPVLIAAGMLISPSTFAKKKADLQFAPETVEKSGPPSKAMQKALKLYERRDYYSASIELHRVIDGNTGDSAANKQRAEFWMGKTLFHLRFYSASLSYFDRIVENGDGHRYYNATLKWLASLSRKLPESAGILEKIGKYSRKQLEQPALSRVRDELFYLLGRYHYSQGAFKDAIGLFSAVPRSSSFFARAKFMEGITYVRLYQAKPAAGAFKDLLRIAQQAPDTKEIKQFEELATLSLARVFYSVRQYDLSVKYYEQIPRTSSHWLPALFETSWAEFMRNNFSKALGNIHTLNAPYFENMFFPESLILKAVIYFKNCLYERSEAAIAEFNGQYPALRRELLSVLKRYKDQGEFYGYALKIQRESAGLSEPAGRLARSALSDQTLRKSFRYVDELDRELKQVEAADQTWKTTAIAGVILQDLTLQKSLAENAAGDLAQRRIKRVVDEINELRKQAIRVEYEIINGKKNKLEASLRNEQVVPANTREGQRIEPNDEQHYWPFTGEYWRDELGYYRFRISSKCSR